MSDNEMLKTVFKETGYKFMKLIVNTCKICYTFQIKINQSKNEAEYAITEKEKCNEHKEMTDLDM